MSILLYSWRLARRASHVGTGRRPVPTVILKISEPRQGRSQGAMTFISGEGFAEWQVLDSGIGIRPLIRCGFGTTPDGAQIGGVCSTGLAAGVDVGRP